MAAAAWLSGRAPAPAEHPQETLAQLQDHRMREALVEAIKHLPEREQYVMSMYYEHDMNLKEIAAVLTAAGLDAASFGKRIQDQDVKDRLKATTDEAVTRGVFGAPTCFVDSTMFFGNDRLPFVEMALNGELK